MAKWLIFGAGSGTGALVLQQALKQQQPVVLLIRQPDVANTLLAQGLNVIIGDALDPVAVDKACQQAGSDATIICTLGGRGTNYHAHRLIIDTAERYGIQRMLMVTSLSCGENWAYVTPRAKAAFGFNLREKTLGESWLKTSEMDYIIVRPGGLKNGAATGHAQCYFQQEVHGYVNRSDVANLLVEFAKRAELGKIAYSVVDPTLS